MTSNRKIGYAVLTTIADSLKPDKQGKAYGRGTLQVIPLYEDTDITMPPGVIVRSVSLSLIAGNSLTLKQ